MALIHIRMETDVMQECVTQYVKDIETQNTNKWCSCQWIIHPDDIDKPQNQRRIRHGEPDLNCAIHTKEGFLLGFFTWLAGNTTV